MDPHTTANEGSINQSTTPRLVQAVRSVQLLSAAAGRRSRRRRIMTTAYQRSHGRRGRTIAAILLAVVATVIGMVSTTAPARFTCDNGTSTTATTYF